MNALIRTEGDCVFVADVRDSKACRRAPPWRPVKRWK